MPEPGMVGRGILVDEKRERRSPKLVVEPHAAWSLLGWLGLVLALAGATDLVLLLIPLRLGSPEWEFATVVSFTSGMPLVSIGLAALAGSGAARGTRWLMGVTGTVFAVGSLVLVVLLLLFVTNVPVAMRAASGGAELGITKAIVKTVILGALFGVAYAVGAVWTLKLAMTKGTGAQA